MPKMEPARSVLLLTYGTMALAMGLGISQAAISLEIFGPRSDAERTVLEQRVESAREIKASLHKPLLPIAALPPITAKLANPVKAAAREQPGRVPWLAANSLPSGALDAMAMAKASNDVASSDTSSHASSSSRYSVPFDRATRAGF